LQARLEDLQKEHELCAQTAADQARALQEARRDPDEMKHLREVVDKYEQELGESRSCLQV
jgi:hypothetical protein